MKKFLPSFSVLVFLAGTAYGQLYQNFVSLQWDGSAPVTGNDYATGFSGRGFHFAYHQFLGDQASVGFEVGTNVYQKYIPRQTYVFDGGALTTDYQNYMQVLSGLFAGNYFFRLEGPVVPYVGLGMGVGYTSYTQYYNVYSNKDSKLGFAAEPSAGLLLRRKDYSSWGLRVGVHADYVSSGLKDYEPRDILIVGVQLGAVILHD